MSEIVASHKSAGGHFFDRDAMKFFNSRICTATLKSGKSGQQYFVTSERDDWGGERMYTIRSWNPAKPQIVETVGLFQAYDSLRQARIACERSALE